MAGNTSQLDISITAPTPPECTTILSPAAINFVARLHSEFEERRRELLERRRQRQALIDDGAMPDFLPDTEAIRKDDWKVAPVPSDLQDRRVEITGPVDRKM